VPNQAWAHQRRSLARMNGLHSVPAIVDSLAWTHAAAGADVDGALPFFHEAAQWPRPRPRRQRHVAGEQPRCPPDSPLSVAASLEGLQFSPFGLEHLPVVQDRLGASGHALRGRGPRISRNSGASAHYVRQASETSQFRCRMAFRPWLATSLAGSCCGGWPSAATLRRPRPVQAPGRRRRPGSRPARSPPP